MTEKDYEDEKHAFGELIDERTEQEKVDDELYMMLVGDPDIEAINEALGPDAFSRKEYNKEWVPHIKACGKAIQNCDYCVLGRLISDRAKKHLKGRALAKVNEW